jgi:branched-subunit amino acid ABC-type transport system permease component
VEGAYFGALLVGLAKMLPLAVIPTRWQEAMAFLVLIVFVLVRPTGPRGPFLSRPPTARCR